MAGIFWSATCSVPKTKFDVNEGKSVTLELTTTAKFGTIRWKRRNSTSETFEYSVNNSRNYYLNRTKNEISLKIKNVAESDEGEYVCEVHTWKGIVKSPVMTLNVWNVIRYPKTKIEAEIERPILLVCEIENPNPDEDIDITWTKNGKDIDEQKDRRLMIKSVCEEDAGIYECRVNGIAYPRQPEPTKSICLEVNPTVKLTKTKLAARIHYEVKIDCTTSGADEYEWKHDGKVISTADIRYKVNDDLSLTISAVEWSDAGRYVCEIKNFSTGKKATSDELELCIINYSEDKSDGSLTLKIEKEKQQIKALLEQIPEDSPGCFWFIGSYGAGKSSTISSFETVTGGNVSTIAIPGSGETPFTTQISGYEMYGGKVVLYDIPGIQGRHPLDNQQFRYTPFDDIIKTKPEDYSWRACVVYVIDSSDAITEDDIKRMNQFCANIKQKDNLQMVALLTKIDKVSKGETTVEGMANSLEVWKVKEQISRAAQLPKNCIFSICNYSRETDIIADLNIVIFRALRGILVRLVDIYKRSERAMVPT